MIAYERILYTKGIDVNKELAIARWLQSSIGELNRKFSLEAMEKGNHIEFLKGYVGVRWFGLCISN